MKALTNSDDPEDREAVSGAGERRSVGGPAGVRRALARARAHALDAPGDRRHLRGKELAFEQVSILYAPYLNRAPFLSDTEVSRTLVEIDSDIVVLWPDESRENRVRA